MVNDMSDSESISGHSYSDKSRNSGRFLSTGFTLMGYTFMLQLGLHVMTFFLNGLAYHRLDASSIGLVNMRIGLFYTTLMFVARDAFRRAFLSRGGELVTDHLVSRSSSLYSDSEPAFSDGRQRGLSGSPNRFSGLIDLAWTILPLGFAVALFLLIVWIWVLPSPGTLATMFADTRLPVDILQYRYVVCLFVYTISGLFELATEPFWLVCQLSHLVRARICIEAIANAMRVCGIVCAVFTIHPDYAIYSVALPQILHGTTLFVGYLVFFHRMFNPTIGEISVRLQGIRKFRDLFPRITGFSVDQRALKLAKNLFGQGLLKQLLTEGERYLISGFHLLSFTDQGIYDMINNLGSTATRLLFLPMEESCHFVFNQCLNRGLSPSQQDPILLKNVFRMFRTVLRTCSLIAWIGITFSQANSRLLLSVYAGSTLANNPMAYGLLRLYAVYVLLLAWNGSTEAFLNAAMSPVDVARHNKRLITFSLVFLGANWLFVPWFGARGFLVANGINILCRIFYSCSYVNQFVRSILLHRDRLLTPGTSSDADNPVFGFSLVRLMFPSMYEVIVLLCSLLATLVSEFHLCCAFGALMAVYHAAITGSFLLVTLCVMYYEERDLIYILQTEVFHAKSE